MPFRTQSALALLLGSAMLLAATPGEAAHLPRVTLSPRFASAPAPPPQAPVDGHAHAHPSGALLRFDSELGVYTVTGAANLYFFRDAFIRNRSGLWEFSERPSGPWEPGRAEWVPIRLRAALYHDVD